VAPFSHLRSAFALGSLAASSARSKPVQLALSEPGTDRDVPPRRGHLARTGSPSHALLLAGAYALSPTLALLTWRALSAALPATTAAVASVGLLLLLPSLVHVARGAMRRAALVFASLLAHLALGGALGAALGRELARASCAAEMHGECGLTVLAWLLVGAAAGCSLGYSVHAVRQVRAFAGGRRRSAHATR
jgi:hypothetical protein